MRELQPLLSVTKRYQAQGTAMFRIASLFALLLLCACQTTTPGQSKRSDPDLTPAFRKEMADRGVAFWANKIRWLPFFSPFRITDAWISESWSWGGARRCVTFVGDGGQWAWTSTVITYSYDKTGKAHITGVYYPDPDEDRDYCLRVYPFPEAVGRMVE